MNYVDLRVKFLVFVRFEPKLENVEVALRHVGGHYV